MIMQLAKLSGFTTENLYDEEVHEVVISITLFTRLKNIILHRTVIVSAQVHQGRVNTIT